MIHPTDLKKLSKRKSQVRKRQLNLGGIKYHMRQREGKIWVGEGRGVEGEDDQV